MSEEQENDGTWSGLKKTIIGTIATAVTAGGAWVTTTLFSGGEQEEKTKTEQVAPAQAPVINLNVDNSSQNNSTNGAGTTTVIKEKTVEKAAPAAPAKPEKKSESEDAPW
jgi:hypothetical protein